MIHKVAINVNMISNADGDADTETSTIVLSILRIVELKIKIHFMHFVDLLWEFNNN